MPPVNPDYAKYMESEQWQIIRRLVIERDGYACVLCNRKSDGRLKLWMSVHHRTYVRLGQEQLTDLFTLCTECHAANTDRLKRIRERSNRRDPM